MKLKALAIILALSLTPAYASSIVQFNGDTYAKGVNSKDAPVVGIDIPSDAIAARFLPWNNDTNINHYKVVNGYCWYIPADGSTSFQVPDPVSALLAIKNDATIDPTTKQTVQHYTSILMNYPLDMDGAKSSWQSLIKKGDASGLVSGDAAKVETWCALYGCPLTNPAQSFTLATIPSNYVRAGNGSQSMVNRPLTLSDLPSGITPGFNINDTVTTVNGTAGNFKWQEQFQGVSKRVLIQVNGYTNTTAKSVTIPVAFSSTPYVSSNSAAVTLTSLSATGFTFPLSVTLINGNIVIDGF